MSTSNGLGQITFTFDDGLLNQFEHGRRVLKSYGVPAVVFVPTGLVGDWYRGERVMDVDHLKELVAAGWEIGSHTVSHPRLVELPLEALENELRESREWILSNGWPAPSFAYPFGRYNDEVATLVRRYYAYARTIEYGLNDASSGDVRLKAFDLRQCTAAHWQAVVDAAVAEKKWLVVMMHGVAASTRSIPPGKGSLDIAADTLAAAVEYALSSGLPIRTFADIDQAWQHLPEAADQTCAPVRPLPAGVEIKVRIDGERARIAVKDRRRGFKLRFEHPSGDKETILSELRRRIALDLDLSPREIDQLVEFVRYE